ARGVDVQVGGDQLVGRVDDLDRGVLLDDAVEGGAVDVGDEDAGVLLDQMADQVAADLADPGDADTLAGQGGVTPGERRCGAHALVHAVGGHDAGVARAAVLDGAAGD